MKEIEGPILPKICDWILNKNYESQFPSFRHRVKAITRESRTLPLAGGNKRKSAEYAYALNDRDVNGL